MIDVLYLAWNRIEFTRKTFETMVTNTDWSKVARLIVYDDGSTDRTLQYLREAVKAVSVESLVVTSNRLGPVGIMREFLSEEVADVFAKVDSDTMLPPNWLNECLDVMEANPEVDLLGIEARVDADKSGPPPRTVYDADFIGGIGLMRRRAFETDLPSPDGPSSRFGFTAWQEKHAGVKKAWINPPLPVCLLNMVPFEPWASLSREYVRNGYQRPWPDVYTEKDKGLWEWWA